MNPFTIHRYEGPEYFCNRNIELSKLIEMFDNQRHGLISSIRRVGKTGLIHHFHNFLSKRKKVVPIFVDVFATNSDQAFVRELISASVQAIDKSQSGFLKQAGKVFSRLRPAFSFDPLTGVPSITFDIQTKEDVQFSIKAWAAMLSKFPLKFQIAIDEFQQISNYKETSIDAELRSIAQLNSNIHFIFSGSEQHLLTELFGNAQKPLFSTVDMLSLDFLDQKIYASFIKEMFALGKKKIQSDAIEEILSWTKGHTYYTQMLCNKIYSSSEKSIELTQVETMKNEIFFDREPTYKNYQTLLSKNQWKMLVHCAKNNKIENKISNSMIQSIGISYTSARQALDVLIKNGFLYHQWQPEGDFLILYDVFLSRWLQSNHKNLIY